MASPSSLLYPSRTLYPGSLGPFTAGIQASLAPWEDTAGIWQELNAALGIMFEQTYGLVSDVGSPDQPAGYTAGWSTLLDPTACPTWALPYLAAFVGAIVPPGTDDATARSLITSEQGMQRGTPAAITSAAKRHLTGTQSVSLLERTPDPYSFQLVVRPEEAKSASALQAAVDAVRPAGIRWTLVQADQYTWNQAVHTYAADTITWNQTASLQP